MRITEVTVRERQGPRRGGTTLREYNSRTRVYFHPQGESVLQNLENRTVRPSKLYSELFPELIEKGVLAKDDKWRWSQYAGCSCPCSPGFVLKRTVRRDDGRPVDIHVSVVGNDASIAEGSIPRDVIGAMA